MKRLPSFIRHLLVGNGVMVLLASQTQAQVNSWTKPASGKWEEAYWSAGTLPGTNQAILITNANWKAVMISATTSASFPQTLTVDSITLASPTNTFNVLLLNYAGVATPLRVHALTVASNTALTLLSSALVVNDPGSSTFSIGGTVNQSDYANVSATNLDLGYIGPGVYNLTNGTLATGTEFAGGGFPALMNQVGGLHTAWLMQLNSGAEFDLRGGWFTGDITLNGGTVSQQSGTNSSAHLALNRGQYLMNGGLFTGGITLTATFTQNAGNVQAGISAGSNYGGQYVLNGGTQTGGFTAGTGLDCQSASMLQMGGTHSGDVTLGGGSDLYGRSYYYGDYTLSNGLCLASAITVTLGSFTQWQGSNQVNGAITLVGGLINFGNTFASGSYTLQGGTLSATSLVVNAGSYLQAGGTNRIAGDVNVRGVYNSPFTLNGGWLADANTHVQYTYTHGFIQNRGTHVVTNLLSVDAGGTPGAGYQQAGGQLIVSNLQINAGAQFIQTGGNVVQAGTLTLANGTCRVAPGTQQFGRMQLSTAGNTNSTLGLPATACHVQFNASSSLTWSNEPLLAIENWSGSLAGGGSQQILFGNNASGLTARQTGQLRFHDPAGLPAGNYLAKILATGEVVPEGKTISAFTLSPQTKGTMKLQLQAVAGHTYQIDVSTDLVTWVAWTNQCATNGSLMIMDPAATNYPHRFYRAVLSP